MGWGRDLPGPRRPERCTARPRAGPLRAALGGLCRPWDPGDPCASARLRGWDLPGLLCVARAPRFPTSNFLPRCGRVHWPGRRGLLPGHLGATGQSWPPPQAPPPQLRCPLTGRLGATRQSGVCRGGSAPEQRRSRRSRSEGWRRFLCWAWAPGR